MMMISVDGYGKVKLTYYMRNQQWLAEWKGDAAGSGYGATIEEAVNSLVACFK